MIRFTENDKQRITAAIQAAEQKTSGEFVAVVARASDHYLSIPLLWAALLALLLPGLVLFSSLSIGYFRLYELQLATFILLALLFEFVPALHLWLVPKGLKHARASRLAHAQFFEQGVHLTQHHSGVLLFVSLAERYVEIVADQGIHAKIGESRWQEIVKLFVDEVSQGKVTDGFVAAIGACGAAMAEHYPAIPGKPNELSDGLIEI
jgi:putative membrane protein